MEHSRPCKGATPMVAGTPDASDSDASNTISLKQVHAFIAVVQSRNITVAAGHMHMTQSGLTRVIQSLESFVGQALFTRGRQSVNLTPAGQNLLPHALRLADVYAETLGIGDRSLPAMPRAFAVTSVALPFILPHLLDRAARNEANAPASFHELPSHQIVEEIVAGRMDMGVCFASDALPNGIERRPLIRVPLGLLASKKVSLPPSIHTLADCLRLNFVRLQDEFVLPVALRADNVTLDGYRNAAVVCCSMEALHAVVNEGRLVTFVSALAAMSPAAEGSQFVPLPHLLPPMELCLVWNAARCSGCVLDHWAKAVLEALRARRWDHGMRLLIENE